MIGGFSTIVQHEEDDEHCGDESFAGEDRQVRYLSIIY